MTGPTLIPANDNVQSYEANNTLTGITAYGGSSFIDLYYGGGYNTYTFKVPKSYYPVAPTSLESYDFSFEGAPDALTFGGAGEFDASTWEVVVKSSFFYTHTGELLSFRLTFGFS